MFSCFKKKDRGPSETKPVEYVETVGVKTIALIAGHQENGGARAYNEAEENEVNSRLVEEIIRSMPNHKIITRKRGHGSYSSEMKKHAKFCRDNKAEIAIELHFNAAGVPEARGAEALIKYGALDTISLAGMIVDKWCTQFDIKKRGNYRSVKGVKALKSRDRGAGFVNYMESYGIKAIVWEPFFCDYETEESQRFLNQRDQGVRIMANFWVNIIKQITK